MNKTFSNYLILGISVVFLAPQTSWSFTLNNSVEAKFQGDFVAVNFSATSNCENTGRSVEKIRSLVDLALKKFWNSVSTSDLDIRPGSLLAKGAQFETDPLCVGGVNSPCEPNPSMSVDDGIFVVCNDHIANFPSGSIAGATLTNNIDSTKLKGAVITLNNRSGSFLPAVSDDTFVAIIAHEVGHAFGLDHSPHKENLMYYSTVPKRDELGWDDIDAVTYLYPREDKILGLVGCDIVDLNGREPSGLDQDLKVYHLGIEQDKINSKLRFPMPSRFNYFASLLLGLMIFPIGYRIFKWRQL